MNCNFCLPPPSFVSILYIKASDNHVGETLSYAAIKCYFLFSNRNILSHGTPSVGAIILLICWHLRKMKEIKPKRLITVKCSVPSLSTLQNPVLEVGFLVFQCWKCLNYNMIISMNYYTITWYASVSGQFMLLLHRFSIAKVGD